MSPLVGNNQPLRRLQFAIDNFNNYAREDITDLDKLEDEIRVQFASPAAAELLHGVHQNGVQVKLMEARQVGQRLQARLRDVDKLRAMVVPGDLDKLNDLVSGMEVKAAQSVLQFAEFQTKVKQELQKRQSNQNSSSSVSKVTTLDRSQSAVANQFYSLSILDDQRTTEQQMTRLAGDVQQLEGLMTDMATVVHQDASKVESIENHVTQAEAEQLEGTKALGWASRAKTAVLPVTGALVGCALGGPVGLFVGMKVGAAAGMLGGMIGYAGGRFVKSRNTVVDPYRYHQLALTDSSQNNNCDELDSKITASAK